MYLEIFPSGPYSTNNYVIGCPLTKKAAAIDPAPGSLTSILHFLEEQNLHLDKILLTHSHWDHIADVKALKEAINGSIPVYIHSSDVANLEKPGADGIPFNISIDGVKPDVLLKDGDHIAVGSLDLVVIHTPGHSKGSICLYCPAEKILFSGDTLFAGTMGQINFPFSQPESMWDSLKKLAELPSDTEVYPGHGRKTSIGQETWLNRARERFGMH